MKERQKAYLYLIITTAAWGSTYVAGKYVMESIPAFTLLFVRYSIAVIIMAAIYKRGTHEKVRKEDYKYLLTIGFFGYFGVGLQLAGIQFCDASLASLINSTNPVVIILIAIPVLKEKVTLYKIIAVIITMLGAGIIIGHIGNGSELIGVALSIASVLSWSFATALIRLISSKYDTLTITMYGMAIAILCAFPVSVYQIFREGTAWSAYTPGVIASVLYIGVVSTTLAFFLWNKALSMVDAATCSLFYPIQPFVSTLLGALLLGEVITVNFIIGGLLIIGGILYAMLMDAKTVNVKISGKIGQGDT